MVGTPIEVDHRTVARINIDGPRFHVIVDAKTPPPEHIKIKLPNGKLVTQKILFDFYPMYCSTCKRMGHLTTVCRARRKSIHGLSPLIRDVSHAGNENDSWQVVRGRRNKNGNTHDQRKGSRVRGAERSKSCPPGGQLSTTRPGPSVAARGTIPNDIPNVHTYIASPLPSKEIPRNQTNPTEKEAQPITQSSVSQPPSERQSHVAQEGDVKMGSIDEDQLSEAPSHVPETQF